MIDAGVMTTNLAVADAVIAMQPAGPPRAHATELAYGRIWRRWLAGERWDGPSPSRTYYLAGVRWGALRELVEARRRLSEALEGDDAEAAAEAAGAVHDCLRVLGGLPRDRRGRRAGS